MILATMRMTLPVKKFSEGLAIIKSLSEQSKAHIGCLSSQVYRNGNDDNILMFQQIWSNEECMERYLCSDEYQQVLLVLETAIKQPEIRFDIISSSMGIETIQKARNRNSRWETM